MTRTKTYCPRTVPSVRLSMGEIDYLLRLLSEKDVDPNLTIRSIRQKLGDARDRRLGMNRPSY